MDRYLDSSYYSLKPLHEEDLSTIRSWRNHSKVNQFMFNRNHISESEHRLWFEKQKLDSSKHCYIFTEDDVPMGFLSFDEITDGRIAEWGFYLCPSATKGMGTLLGKTAINYGFNTLNFHKIFGRVLCFNHRSIRLHQKLGFKEEGVMSEQYFDGKTYHSIILFGLIASDVSNRAGV